MTETPDKTPDELLKTVQKAHRGKLKLFFGAAPGVGKTYTMLQEAQEKRAQGLDVLVGWVDTHHRADTEMKLAGLTVLPRKIVKTADFTYEEFDIDAVLAKRPALVIVDELAHSNAPGSRHPKRWQDVEELLAAGIDVYSALNVQHLESLNDVVERMIGVDVRETVPDRLFDEADEVRLVDLPPADIIARLKAGKIYLKQTIPAALAGFFKKGNLLAPQETPCSCGSPAPRVPKNSYATGRGWRAAIRPCGTSCGLTAERRAKKSAAGCCGPWRSPTNWGPPRRFSGGMKRNRRSSVTRKATACERSW